MNLTQLNHIECPNCGGALEPKAGTAILECPYCGAKFKDDSAPAAVVPAKAPSPAVPSPAHGQKDYALLLAEAIRVHTVSPEARHTVIGREAVLQDAYRYGCAKTKLNIPESAQCYLLYSDSFFGFDKGFALCTTGLYCCAEHGPDAGKPLHITWPQFAKGTLHTSGNRLYIGPHGFYIYDETGAGKLLAILQKLHSAL